MALDLWFREDVARILASVRERMQASTVGWSHVSPRLATAYQQGFDDALYAVGIAFGVATPAPPRPIGPSENRPTPESDGHHIYLNQGGGRS